MGPLFAPIVAIMTSAGSVLGAVIAGLWIPDMVAIMGLFTGAAVGAIVGVVLAGIFARV